MKQKILRLPVLQNALIVGVVAAFLALLHTLVQLVMVQVGPSTAARLLGGSALLGPLMYLIVGYIATAVCCMVYNCLATRIGCLEFELQA